MIFSIDNCLIVYNIDIKYINTTISSIFHLRLSLIESFKILNIGFDAEK